MKRLLAAVGLLVVVVAPAVALASVSEPARLSRVVCHRALDPAARYVSETAVMRPVAGTARLAVRFRLLERDAGSRGYAAVTASGLDRWISPDDPTLGQRPGDVWKVVKPVADLAAPAWYRFAVDFRWLDGRGRAIGAVVTRVSRRCFEPELRPDLVVRSIGVAADPLRPGSDDYLVTLENTGATAAGPFSVSFTNAGVEHEQTVDRLDAHSTRRLTFVGPACRVTDPPSVTADSQDQVDVWTRTQATLIAACPSAG